MTNNLLYIDTNVNVHNTRFKFHISSFVKFLAKNQEILPKGSRLQPIKEDSKNLVKYVNWVLGVEL